MGYSFLKFCSDVVGVVGAPFTFGGSLVVSHSARKIVKNTTKALTGDKSAHNIQDVSDNDSSINNMNKEQNRLNELTTRSIEDITGKLKEIESRFGVPQPISKIQDSQKLSKAEIAKLIEEARTASPERRKEIIEEITEKVKKEQEEADRILKEERNKIEKQKNQNLAKAQEEQNSGNSAKAKALYSEAEKQAQTINQQNKLIAEMQKKAKEREETAKNLINDAGSTS
jgi:hypothetical protein